jgi:ubiquitin carboxyl-terminal hydrolase L3
MPKSWAPLESNPDVVTTFAKKLGLDESLSYIDIYSTEEWALDMIPKPVYAVSTLSLLLSLSSSLCRYCYYSQ